jgi:hypothetical protein
MGILRCRKWGSVASEILITRILFGKSEEHP